MKIWSQKCSQKAAIRGKRWYSLGPTEHPLDSCTYGRYVRNSCVINIKNEDKLDFFQCTQAPRECWMGGDKCDLLFVLTTLPWQTFRNQTQINVLTCWSLYSWQRSIILISLSTQFQVQFCKNCKKLLKNLKLFITDLASK